LFVLLVCGAGAEGFVDVALRYEARGPGELGNGDKVFIVNNTKTTRTVVYVDEVRFTGPLRTLTNSVPANGRSYIGDTVVHTGLALEKHDYRIVSISGDGSTGRPRPPVPANHVDIDNIPNVKRASEHKELEVNVHWCLTKDGRANLIGGYYQDGIVLFEPGGSYLKPMASIRDTMLQYQEHNKHVQDVIRSASDEDLRNCILRILPAILKETQGNLQWVASHESRIADLKKAAAAADGDRIRSIFNEEQSHNRHPRVLIKAVPDAWLVKTVKGF
jgi:hypothetical protein